MTLKLKKALFGEPILRTVNASWRYYDTLFPYEWDLSSYDPLLGYLRTTPPFTRDLGQWTNPSPGFPTSCIAWNEIVNSRRGFDGYWVPGGYNTPEYLAAQNTGATYLPAGESYSPVSQPLLTEVRDPKYLEMINSSNTIGWPGTQGVRVGGLLLTKKRPPTNRPRKPIYRLPRFRAGAVPVFKGPVFLSLIPPVAYASEGSSSYRARLDKWSDSKKRREDRLTHQRTLKYEASLKRYNDRLLKEKKLISDYDAVYAKRLAKYQSKLDLFNRLVSESKKPQYKKSPSYKGMVLKDNPFGHIAMTFTGPIRHITTQYGFPYDYFDGQYTRQRGWFTPAGELLGYNPFSYFSNPSGNGSYADPGTFCLRLWVVDSPMPNPNNFEALAQLCESVRTTIVQAIEPHLDDYDRKLRRKIHSKLKGQVVHVGNLIAERKQTMDLIQSTVKRILKLVKAKKNILKSAAAYAKDSVKIAGDILAFKFGVEPLINDIQAFAKYIDETSDEPLVVARSNIGKPSPIKGGRNSGIPISVQTSLFKFEGMLEMSYTVKCKVTNPAARSLSQFGLINPLEIAWEILPWSFVIDWFVPVGDWLSSQTSDCGLEFVTGTRKIKLTGSFTLGDPQNAADPSSDQTDYSFGGLIGSFDGFVVDRKVLYELPDVPLPVIKNPWSWSHGIESVALAVQRLKK